MKKLNKLNILKIKKKNVLFRTQVQMRKFIPKIGRTYKKSYVRQMTYPVQDY